MPAAPLPPDEERRLRALQDLEILDTPASPDYDLFPLLARTLFGAPMAAVSLVAQDRQWFKARSGIAASQTPRDVAFCAHAILHPEEVLCVPDATKDPRFADNPLVTGEFGLRFYAGAPVLGPDGDALGTVCVIDQLPREADPAMLDHLRHLATGVGSALKLHASVRRLGELATTDALTGLANRAAFDRRLDAALAWRAPTDGARTQARQVALMVLDLDGFKPINDMFGHASGDAALKEVARRLRHVLEHVGAGQDGAAFRFGGDEFCVLLADADEASPAAIAARVHASLADPFLLNGHDVKLRTSIGIALGLAGACQPQQLTADADAALYDAKRSGRGQTRLAGERAAATAQLPGRRDIEARLRAALRPGHEPFEIALQPIMDSTARRILSFEALVRWPQPDGRLMSPATFIPIAEANGLIVPLDRWVLHQACAIASGWPAEVGVSSNLSAANFFASDLVDDVRAALDQHGVAPARLQLEITETVMLQDPVRVRGVLARLREMGVRIALDDFGAGHASIAYLRDYGFDALKIDQAFVADLETDKNCRAFVRAIIAMARTLELTTTAEGVETQAQAERLRRKGIDALQGYLLGRPMTAEAAARMIAAHAPVHTRDGPPPSTPPITPPITPSGA